MRILFVGAGKLFYELYAFVALLVFLLFERSKTAGGSFKLGGYIASVYRSNDCLLMSIARATVHSGAFIISTSTSSLFGTTRLS
jgi:hypothetical protein